MKGVEISLPIHLDNHNRPECVHFACATLNLSPVEANEFPHLSKLVWCRCPFHGREGPSEVDQCIASSLGCQLERSVLNVDQENQETGTRTRCLLKNG